MSSHMVDSRIMWWSMAGKLSFHRLRASTETFWHRHRHSTSIDSYWSHVRQIAENQQLQRAPRRSKLILIMAIVPIPTGHGSSCPNPHRTLSRRLLLLFEFTWCIRLHRKSQCSTGSGVGDMENASDDLGLYKLSSLVFWGFFCQKL